jgi:diguanylate cyclase (GGDEF)-like protein/PAS domain S-box-containing protein
MAAHDAGDEARLVATVLQAFEEAGSDYEPVLDLVCRLGCELTGDAWVIRLVDDDGELRLAGASAADAETTADLRSTIASLRTVYLKRYMDPVWGDGTPVLLTREVLEANTPNAQREMLDLADRRGLVGGVLAPMRVRGRVVGVLWWACQQHDGDHDDDDVRFASSVADRCALAIDNARLLANVEAERNRHAALLANVSDAVCVVDTEGTISHVTPGGVTRVIGWHPEDLLGSNVFDLVHRKDQERALEGFVHAIGPDDLPPMILRVRHRDGGWRQLEITANNLLDDDAIGGVVVTARDVTERVVAETLLNAENDILERVAVGAPVAGVLDDVCRMVDAQIRRGVTTVWLVDDVEKQLVAVAGPNAGPLPRVDTTEGELGVSYVQVLPTDAIWVSPVETGPEWAPWRDAALASGLRCSWTLPIQNAEGNVYGAMIVYRTDDARPTELEAKTVELAARLAGLAVHRARDADRLAHAATHDLVTTLPNRRLFLDRLQQAVARQRRGARPPAVLFVDLDRFKQVNDRAGHATGDEVLRVLGERLLNVVRPTDVVARFGGDEFAVLCDETAEDAAVEVANRLLAAICEPLDMGVQRHLVSASIGIAAGRAGVSHDALIRRADVAMYRAKAQGSGGIVAFRSGMSERTRGDLEQDLRRAIEGGEIAVHYQPIADLVSGTWMGVEALARWRHPRHGWVSPTTFIALAEETGLIAPLGEQVLRCAMEDRMQWERDGVGAGELSINVSGRQITEPRFAATLEDHLTRSGIDPCVVRIELTETTMMEDYDTARTSIAHVQELGVKLVIDDFGTGHSTLARLRHFPATGLKLDRSFVVELGADPTSERVIAAVVQLAHAVDLHVVAEGVETPEQLMLLHRLGVDGAQGFLLAMPMAGADVVEVLRGRADALDRAGLPSIVRRGLEGAPTGAG